MTNLVFENYKEPLTQIPKGFGFGYFGVVLKTEDNEKIQCHICGGLYQTLLPHLKLKHNVTKQEYKERFEIAGGTKLCSKKFSDTHRTLFTSMFSKEELEKKAKKGLVNAEKVNKENGTRGGQTKLSLEIKNKRGNCPDQCLFRISELAKKLGKTPTSQEFIQEVGEKYFAYIRRTFGSYGKALNILRLKREPIIYRGGSKKRTKEELLEYLQIFEQENGRKPVYSDYGYGLLPAYTTYKRHKII